MWRRTPQRDAKITANLPSKDTRAATSASPMTAPTNPISTAIDAWQTRALRMYPSQSVEYAMLLRECIRSDFHKTKVFVVLFSHHCDFDEGYYSDHYNKVGKNWSVVEKICAEAKNKGIFDDIKDAIAECLKRSMRRLKTAKVARFQKLLEGIAWPCLEQDDQRRFVREYIQGASSASGNINQWFSFLSFSAEMQRNLAADHYVSQRITQLFDSDDFMSTLIAAFDAAKDERNLFQNNSTNTFYHKYLF